MLCLFSAVMYKLFLLIILKCISTPKSNFKDFLYVLSIFLPVRPKFQWAQCCQFVISKKTIAWLHLKPCRLKLLALFFCTE